MTCFIVFLIRVEFENVNQVAYGICREEKQFSNFQSFRYCDGSRLRTKLSEREDKLFLIDIYVHVGRGENLGKTGRRENN